MAALVAVVSNMFFGSLLVGAVAHGVAYHDLRVLKDGVSTRELADVSR